MAELQEDKKIHFGAFEFDLSTGELHKNGHPVRLQGQPARLLSLLAGRPGELVTRAEIQKALWPDGRFVEFEHAINTAVKKIREALDDDSDSPKFIETLPKLGYRFTAALQETPSTPKPHPETPADEEFAIPYPRFSRSLFLLIQAAYLAMYCAVLHYVSGLEAALARIGLIPVGITVPAVLVIAMCGIAVRLYLITAVGWRHPAAGRNFLRLFPFAFILDALWSVTPLLAIESLGTGSALAGVAGMAYLPFAQRTLMKSVYKKR
jgi:cholera toxin transcriptional activator